MLPTPALLVDRGVLLDNIAAMAARACTAHVALRPHGKTHKSAEIAKLQVAHGAIGLAVATLREAEYFAEHDVADLLITRQIVGELGLQRLTRLAHQTQVTVAIDDVEVAQAIDDAARRARVDIGLLWELECGARRSGTQPGMPSVEVLASLVPSLRRASFEGLMTYGGHVYESANEAELEAAAEDEAAAVRETAQLLEDRGMPSRVLSIGTTPTACRITERRGVTEIRPGGYVFNDATQLVMGLAAIENCALVVLTTVVSRPTSNRIVLDAGAKALSTRQLSRRVSGFGCLLDHPHLTISRLSDEHGVVESDSPISLRIGDRVKVIPNHAPSTVNQHCRMWVTDDGETLSGSFEIGARGWD